MAGNLSVEEILERDPHVVRIEPGESWEFHEIDYSIFQSRRDMVGLYVQSLKDFLRRPYVIDDFEDHLLRSNWKYVEVLEKYGKDALGYLQRNVLRSATSVIVNHCRDVINEKNYVGTNREIFENKLKDMLGGVVEIRGATREEKRTTIELVKSLKQKVYGLLEFLSQQDPVQQTT